MMTPDEFKVAIAEASSFLEILGTGQFRSVLCREGPRSYTRPAPAVRPGRRAFDADDTPQKDMKNLSSEQRLAKLEFDRVKKLEQLTVVKRKESFYRSKALKLQKQLLEIHEKIDRVHS